MNLYQTLNQDLREFRMKTLLENEEPKVEEVVTETEVVGETEMSEDEIARQLVSLSDALETASEDEIPSIEQEINELKSKLDEIEANREISPSDDDIVMEDSENEEGEVTEEVPAEEIIEEVPAEETPVEEPEAHEGKICLSVDEIKDCIEELSAEDKETLINLLTTTDEVEEVTEETPVEEEFHECEISNFKVVRVAPSASAYMIEAQTKEGIKFITGKNFDAEAKTLDEAEISDSKSDATNRFKDLLANK